MTLAWPYPPDSFTENYSHPSQSMDCYEGAQRVSLATTPHLTIQTTATVPYEHLERSQRLCEAAVDQGGIAVGLPRYSEIYPFAIPPGNTSFALTFASSGPLRELDGYIVVTDGVIAEALQITALGVDGSVQTVACTEAWAAGVTISYAVICMPKAFSAALEFYGVGRVDATFEALSLPRLDTSANSFIEHVGYPVLDTPQMSSTTISQAIGQALSMASGGLTDFRKRRTTPTRTTALRYEFIPSETPQRNNTINLLQSRRGAARAFWLPTYVPLNVVTEANPFICESAGFALSTPQGLYFYQDPSSGGTGTTREVAGVVDLGAGLESVSLLGGTYPATEFVCAMNLVRLAGTSWMVETEQGKTAVQVGVTTCPLPP